METSQATQTQRDLKVVKAGYTPLFRAVAVEDIDAAWPFVSRGLASLIRRRKPTWTELDVKRRLVAGVVGLYLADDGFAIIERCNEAVSMEPYLNVWVLWFRPGKGMPHRERIKAWLNDRQCEFRCLWQQFDSPINGWFGVDSGFTPHTTIWRRKA